MIISVRFPDGEAVDVEVDDERFEQARAQLEATGLTFENAFNHYLQQFLESLIKETRTIQ